MKRIAIESLTPEFSTARPLYHESGALLFAAGERIGEDEIALLRKHGIRKLYDLGELETAAGDPAGTSQRAQEPGPAASPPRAPARAGNGKGGEAIGPTRGSAKIAAYEQGVPVEAPPAGVPVEPAILPEEVLGFRRERRASALFRAVEKAAHGIPPERLVLDPRGDLRDGGFERAVQRCRSGERPEGLAWKERLAGARPVAPRPVRDREEALGARRRALERLRVSFNTLRMGGTLEAAAAAEVTRDVFLLTARDPELALALAWLGPGVAGPEVPGADRAAEPPGSPESFAYEELARHAFDVGVFSVAIAIELGYALEQLVEIACGALFHDVGMLRLPGILLAKPAPLEEPERCELERHPVLAMEVLRRFREVPLALAAIAVEEHERLDGSGYPRGTSEVGEFSQIVAVADVYDALCSPRPHRPAITAHRAVREIIAFGNRKKLDAQTIRALLKSISLFPVGSFVRLSDGTFGRVIGAGQDPARPLVAVLCGEAGPVLDLASRPDLKISDPAAAVPAGDPLVGF